MRLRVKTLLNRTHPIPGFTDAPVSLDHTIGRMQIWVEIAAPRQRAARCSGCGDAAPAYDHLPRREWRHVPPWGIPRRWGCAPWRVRWGRCGVRVTAMPWREGKRPWTRAMLVFLARWARRRSWRETAQAFGVRWEAVSRAVQGIGAWGLAHRVRAGLTALGLDELPWRQGQRAATFRTLSYRVEAGGRRRPGVGRGRTERTVRQRLHALGPPVLAGHRGWSASQRGSAWRWGAKT